MRQRKKDVIARRLARTGYRFKRDRFKAPPRSDAKREAKELSDAKREQIAFIAIGRRLARQERELREERYVTRFYGIPSSWRAIERYAFYFGIGQNENISTIVQQQFKEKIERSHPWAPLSFQYEPKTPAISASAHGAGASIAA